MVRGTIPYKLPLIQPCGITPDCLLYRAALVLLKDPKGNFEPQALLCTVLLVPPEQIVPWFRQRWQLEVTFEEVRAHLGVETQRQWSDMAILRTTPALLTLFSIVVTLAHHWQTQHPFNLPHTAWYRKSLPTFSDAKRQGIANSYGRFDFFNLR